MATVLITGGTGSFGRAFADTLIELMNENDSLRIYSRDEQKQDAMRREVGDDRVRYLLGDVRDYERTLRAVSGCDIVVHAAALKIIPSCEYNPDEVIKTNVMGSLNVINACIEAGVPSLICISSDKAVEPVNLYGNTKACMERSAVLANQWSQNTDISVVRYGNVVGSRGSILTLLKKQAEEGVLRITHRDMTRFWLTLEQACDFVLHALANQEGGEIFVPKIRAASVLELCCSLFPKADIEFTGLRWGEKLHESLSGQYERPEDIGWAWRIRDPWSGGTWGISSDPIRSDTACVSVEELMSDDSIQRAVKSALEP